MPKGHTICMPALRMAYLAFVLCVPFVAGRAGAHAVVADGARDEWSLVLPVSANLGMIVRSVLGVGEYAWQDALGDARTDLGSASPGADIVELRVTADLVNLSVMVQMADVVITQGNQSPMLQIALDLDGLANSGASSFTGNAETQVGDSARWERLVCTHFGSSGGAVVMDGAFTVVGAANVAIDPVSDVIEIVIPWSALGLDGPPASPVRFTAASFLSDASDNAIDIGGSAVSDALDAITNYGDPRSSLYPSTLAELGDGRVDYAFDVAFSPATGEVESPWLLSEVLYNSAAASLEWVEIMNASFRPLSLDGMKLGDEETPDGSEGMRRFPAGKLVPPGASVVAAISGPAFQTAYGFPPDFEVVAASPSVPDLPAYTAWATGVFSLTNAGDEILLLDRWDTVLDVLNYGSGVWAGQFSHGQILPEHSLERVPSLMDRNDCSLDFADRVSPGPHPITADAPGPHGRDALALSVFPNPLRRMLHLRLSLVQAGGVEVQVLDIAGRTVRAKSWPGLPGGELDLPWDLADDSGHGLPTGRYLVRVRAGSQTLVRAVSLVR